MVWAQQELFELHVPSVPLWNMQDDPGMSCRRPLVGSGEKLWRCLGVGWGGAYVGPSHTTSSRPAVPTPTSPHFHVDNSIYLRSEIGTCLVPNLGIFTSVFAHCVWLARRSISPRTAGLRNTGCRWYRCDPQTVAVVEVHAAPVCVCILPELWLTAWVAAGYPPYPHTVTNGIVLAGCSWRHCIENMLFLLSKHPLITHPLHFSSCWPSFTWAT